MFLCNEVAQLYIQSTMTMSVCTYAAERQFITFFKWIIGC